MTIFSDGIRAYRNVFIVFLLSPLQADDFI
jgi:hypothetical protein